MLNSNFEPITQWWAENVTPLLQKAFTSERKKQRLAYEAAQKEVTSLFDEVTKLLKSKDGDGLVNRSIPIAELNRVVQLMKGLHSSANTINEKLRASLEAVITEVTRINGKIGTINTSITTAQGELALNTLLAKHAGFAKVYLQTANESTEDYLLPNDDGAVTSMVFEQTKIIEGAKSDTAILEGKIMQWQTEHKELSTELDRLRNRRTAVNQQALKHAEDARLFQKVATDLQSIIAILGNYRADNVATFAE